MRLFFEPTPLRPDELDYRIGELRRLASAGSDRAVQLLTVAWCWYKKTYEAGFHLVVDRELLSRTDANFIKAVVLDRARRSVPLAGNEALGILLGEGIEDDKFRPLASPDLLTISETSTR